MAWFAASVVMYFRLKDVPQEEFVVWENVFLVDAPDAGAARSKAEALGRMEEGDDDGTLQLNGRPAEAIFGGVRKVVTCAPSLLGQSVDNSHLEDGTEATYSTFIVRNRQDLEAFIRGEPVPVVYEE